MSQTASRASALLAPQTPKPDPIRATQPERGEVAGGLGELAVGAAAQGDVEARVAEFAKLGAFIGGLAEDFRSDELILGWIVELVRRKRGVSLVLEKNQVAKSVSQ